MMFGRFFDVWMLILHSTASAGLLLCLCWAGTGQYLLAAVAGVVCFVSLIAFWKAKPQ